MNMLSLLIGIVGTIFTIFFGYYAIRLSKKEKKFKKLDFIPYECYSLFDSAVKRLKIGINYKETPISNSLILFKGKLRNNGTIDLDNSSIYEPVTVICPDDFKWVEVNALNKPEKINLDLNIIDSNKLQIKWDLLKCDEEFEFEALIETQIDDEIKSNAFHFYDSLKFNFRITDLNRIDKEDLYPIKYKRSILPSLIGSYKFIIGVGVVLLVIGELLSIWKPNIVNEYKPHYNLVYKNDTISSPIKGISTNEISFNSSDSTKSTISVSTKEFNKEIHVLSIKKVEEVSVLKLLLRVSSALYIFLGIIDWIVQLRRKKRRNKNKL